MDGFRISRYGTFLVKRCKWCYNIVKTEEGSEVHSASGSWCSEDCKQENLDWNFLRKLMNAKERSVREWKRLHPIPKKSAKGIKKDRTEYYKKYLEEHRDKKREQAKLAARRYRIKRLKLK